MITPLRCVLVGAGRIAQTYAQVLAASKELTPVAVIDTDSAAANKLAATLRCPAFASPADLLAAGLDVEAVILCTPPVTHRPLATLFMKKGWHVLCEKPFCLDIASARAMIRTATHQGV